MSFEWKNVLALAKFLVEADAVPCREAAERSAASRAYFAAFCVARDYVENEFRFRPTETGEDHRLVREILKKQEKGRLASDLSRLAQWRKSCDYDFEYSKSGEACRYSIQVAEKVIGQLN